MALIKFYALCTKSLPATQRHLKYVPKEDLIYVFNSEDQEYVTKATEWCNSQGLEHYVTQSDGTAATGKNSVLRLFLESSHEFMVLVDGDDFITPHGVWTYKQIASGENAPDAICLYDQYGIWRQYGYDPDIVNRPEDINPFVNTEDRTNPEQICGFGKRIFRMDYNWWETALIGKNITPVDDYAVELSPIHQRWATHCWNYIDKWEPHLRITMMSRKGAEQGVFYPELLVGEDTVRFLELKDAHMRGQITMARHRETYPTYVYDTRLDGVVQWAWDRPRGWLDWLSALTDKYDELEAMEMMHEEQLPEVTVEWPDDYTPDVCGLVAYPAKEVAW